MKIEFLQITLNKSTSKKDSVSQTDLPTLYKLKVLRSRINRFKIKITLTLTPG